jgi:hypothetical protein
LSSRSFSRTSTAFKILFDSLIFLKNLPFFIDSGKMIDHYIFLKEILHNSTFFLIHPILLILCNTSFVNLTYLHEKFNIVKIGFDSLNTTYFLWSFIDSW